MSQTSPKPLRDDDGAAATSAEPSWYDITVAGKRFTIASRYGEEHIRRLEAMLTETYEEVANRVRGQPPLHVALLAAMNLADQLMAERGEHQEAVSRDGRRITQLIEGLDTILYARDSG